tara:strand:- start:19841 stop:20461 length:621 start_codon:yes stop_codon:yes gene_type:complete
MYSTISIPDSLLGYSPELLRTPDSALEGAHLMSINPLPSWESGTKVTVQGTEMFGNIATLINPSPLPAILDFLQGERSAGLVQEYHGLDEYPFGCEIMSRRLVQEMSAEGIDAMVFDGKTHSSYQPGHRTIHHEFALFLVEMLGEARLWVGDYAADQHVGFSFRPEEASVKERRIDRTREVIKRNQINSTPLVGPFHYFSDFLRVQ